MKMRSGLRLTQAQWDEILSYIAGEVKPSVDALHGELSDAKRQLENANAEILRLRRSRGLR